MSKAVKKIGSSFRGMFRPPTYGPQWMAPELFKYTEPLVQQNMQQIGGLGQQLFGQAEDAYSLARSLASGAEDQAQFELARRRTMESLRPGLAARGLLTSGPGIDIESEKMNELATQFGERAFERKLQGQQALQAALAGLANIKSLPIELQQKLLQSIFAQSGQTPALGDTLAKQLFGSEGAVSGMAKLGQAAGTVMMNLVCWVAEELYGRNSVKTALARMYVQTHDNIFTRAYKRHGKTWAKILRRFKFLKPIVRPVWDYMWKTMLKELKKDVASTKRR